MAKKKDFLGDFSFTKFENLGSGVEIPVSNSLKTATNHTPGNPSSTPKSIRDDDRSELGETQVKKPKQKRQETRSKSKSKVEVKIPTFDYANKGVEAMVSVVPTSVKPTAKKGPTIAKRREPIKDTDIDLLELGALETKQEKVVYLAMRGWSLKVEQRRNGLYHYATKYIKRKKKRIYLGPALSEN